MNENIPVLVYVHFLYYLIHQWTISYYHIMPYFTNWHYIPLRNWSCSNTELHTLYTSPRYDSQLPEIILVIFYRSFYGYLLFLISTKNDPYVISRNFCWLVRGSNSPPLLKDPYIPLSNFFCIVSGKGSALLQYLTTGFLKVLNTDFLATHDIDLLLIISCMLKQHLAFF